MEASSSYFPTTGLNMGSSYHRWLCVYVDNTLADMQKSLPVDFRAGCFRRAGLGLTQQLGQPPIPFVESGSNLDSKPRSYSHSDCHQMALSTVVRQVKEDEHRFPNSSSQCVGGVQMHEPRWGAGATKEQLLEDLRFEVMWKQRLLNLGWSARASDQAALAWAKSTMASYNNADTKFQRFCGLNSVPFPPKMENSRICADFMCHVADSSARPESLLRTTNAVIGCLYQTLGFQHPLRTAELAALHSVLVKSGTKVPSKRTKVMPCAPFLKLFSSRSQNEKLLIKQLRLKAVTLLALVSMARPSDLAPRGVLYNGATARVTNRAPSWSGGVQTWQFIVCDLLHCVWPSLG